MPGLLIYRTNIQERERERGRGRRANSVRTNKPNRISSEYLNNLMGREGLACVAKRVVALMASLETRIKGSRRYSLLLSLFLCLSSCTTLISPGAGPRKEAACYPPVLEDRQPETLNKTERKRKKKERTRGKLDGLN